MLVTALQTIKTRYIKPANGSTYIKAETSGGAASVKMPSDFSLNYIEDHARAARQLAEDMEWYGEWIPGAVNNEGDAYIWVMTGGGSIVVRD